MSDRANVFAISAVVLWVKAGTLALVDAFTSANLTSLVVVAAAGATAATCKCIADAHLHRVEVGRLTSLYVPGMQPRLVHDPLEDLERVVGLNGHNPDPHHMM